MKYGANPTFVLSDRHLRQGGGHASSAGSSQNTYKGAFRVGHWDRDCHYSLGMYLGVCPSLDDGQGKLDSEFSATSDVTLHANITVMFLHDSITNRQSKAGTQRHSRRLPLLLTP